jgi:anaerobic magnesium-protoporphyrin IX monomethyl ester cyclase
MKVLLIHPPHSNSLDDRLDPPMGLLYIAAHLEDNNIDVNILDLSGHSQWRIPYADIYGITAYVSTLDITKKIFEECRSSNPQSYIVIGGAHATARPADFSYADQVVQGYGELPMLKICGVNKSSVDLFKFPSYHLVDIHSYSRRIDGNPSLSFLTSRNCPFKCAFCGMSPMHKDSKKIYMMDAEKAASQIARIKDEFGIDRINIQDDIFTMNRKRLFKLLDLIKPLNIKFRCHGRAGYDIEETYARLAESGCDQVAWGIESGSQLILDRMNKQCNVQDNINVIKWAKKYGITTRAFFIIGFPGETAETLEETKRFIEMTDIDQVFVSNMIPYPGTDVGDYPEKYGIIKKYNDYSQYYQVGKDGSGGLLDFDTYWLTREEFRDLEIKFREWIFRDKSIRGSLQNYEKKLYKKYGE